MYVCVCVCVRKVGRIRNARSAGGDWAKKCQELEITPNPRCHDGANKKLSISEMRRAILCKSTKQEVCKCASGSGIATVGKRKHELIEAILLVKDLG